MRRVIKNWKTSPHIINYLRILYPFIKCTYPLLACKSLVSRGSGGGAYVLKGTNSQIGIVSFGDGCGRPSKLQSLVNN